jgi:hypothetical protein
MIERAGDPDKGQDQEKDDIGALGDRQHLAKFKCLPSSCYASHRLFPLFPPFPLVLPMTCDLLATLDFVH